MGLFTTPSLLVGFISILPHEENSIDLQLELLADLTHDPNPDRFDGIPPVYEPEKIMVASLSSIRGLLVQSVVGQTGEEQKIYYFINDHLGTPQKVLDENANVVWSADFKPFGEADVNVITFENRFRLPGQYYDSESGAHYNFHRYYDPMLGRFLTPDPIGLFGGLELYSYVVNDPVNWIDPQGLFGFGLAGGGSISLLNFRAAFDIEFRLIHDSTKSLLQGWQFGFTVTGSKTMPKEVCDHDVFLGGLEFDLGSKILMNNANSFDQLLGKSKTKFGFSGGWGPGANFEHTEMINDRGRFTGIEEVSFGMFPMPGINYGIEAHAGTINETKKVVIFGQN